MTESRLNQLQGPILVLGASGFIGANLLRYLIKARSDVYGTASSLPAWRLSGLPDSNIIVTDVLVEYNLTQLLDRVKPRTVFDCVAYGAYSFQSETDIIYKTNLNYVVRLVKELQRRNVIRYIHAGTSSEYGDNASGPPETASLTPNSHYAASKAAASGLLYYLGKKEGFPCVNLRIYSGYGPYEDSSRLIPNLIAKGLSGQYPPLVNPDVSHDFVYVEDVARAFVSAALNLDETQYGESFNIGTGVKTTIAEIAETARQTFNLEGAPQFTMPSRPWDVTDWYASPTRAADALGWVATTSLKEGLDRTINWYQALPSKEEYEKASKQFGVDTKHSVSAIIAAYKDVQAIPIMYERLTKVFRSLNVDYEIIFVNDNSPDDSEKIICELSARDRHVIGVTHSRNFGSQSAFRSGMEIASKSACVLLDGDLQDPPELIEKFVEKWREGYEVVYGRRVKREAPLHMQFAYKFFYRIFDAFSYIDIPHDAGDFSLIDKRVVNSILSFPERDLFLRGVRAFAGFRQVGVDYERPERMFGVTTNSFLKNIQWAKKGILSFSNTPLNILSTFGILLFSISLLLAVLQVLVKLIFPEMTPPGLTTTLIVITFFGSINLLAVSILGEYIAKIFEEVKQRPHFIRRHIIRDGEIRRVSQVHLSNRPGSIPE